VIPIKAKNGGALSPADNSQHVDPQIVENQPGPAHGGYVKATPAWGETGEDQPIGPGKYGTGQQACTYVEAVEPPGQKEAQIDGAEEITDAISPELVEAVAHIHQQGSQVLFHESALSPLSVSDLISMSGACYVAF
jgi:hypothetical protein